MAAASRVTLRDIAEQTGVTRMAVSLALRGKAGVSEATRNNVLKAAERLGYEPDPTVAKLMTQIRAGSQPDTKACLALITSGATEDEWKRSRTERSYVDGVRARAKRYGYRVADFWMHQPKLTVQRLSNIIWNRGIEGVIIAPFQGTMSPQGARSLPLAYELFSAVQIGETIHQPDLDRAIHDQFTSMLKLIDELTALRYRSIGLVLEESLDLRVNGKWTGAYLQAQRRRGREALPEPLILDRSDQSAFDRWFDRVRPEVIISVNQFGLNFLDQRGLSIPGDVGYASLDLDGIPEGRSGISGIDQNSSRVGAAAVDMLVAAIQRNQRGTPAHPIRTQIEGTFCPGTSTTQQTGSG